MHLIVVREMIGSKLGLNISCSTLIVKEEGMPWPKKVQLNFRLKDKVCAKVQ